MQITTRYSKIIAIGPIAMAEQSKGGIDLNYTYLWGSVCTDVFSQLIRIVGTVNQYWYT